MGEGVSKVLPGRETIPDATRPLNPFLGKLFARNAFYPLNIFGQYQLYRSNSTERRNFYTLFFYLSYTRIFHTCD